MVDAARVIGRTRRCRRRCKRGSRARRRGWPSSPSRSRRSTRVRRRRCSAADAGRARSRAWCGSKAWRRRARRCCSMKAWCGARFRIGGRLAGCWGLRRRSTTAASRERDQGISRAGNKRLQSVMVQLAWGWVHWQRAERADAVVSGALWPGKRARRVGIVALARKLLIALWRYATAGVPPGRRGVERRVVALRASRTRAARTVRAGSRRERPSRRRYRSPRVRLETGWSQGAAPRARARIEGEGEHRLAPHSRTARAHALGNGAHAAGRLRGPLMGGRSARRRARSSERRRDRSNTRTGA